MKIKKNVKVINLTESDLQRIVKRVLKEQPEDNESSDSDYDTSSTFAKSVEDWWGGSSDWTNSRKAEFSEYHSFFAKFQGGFFGNDDEDAAAISYKNKVMNDLRREVGKDNSYYKQLKNWIDSIVDEIDDTFQNPSQTWLHLNSTDGRSSSYNVDPEIDV